MKTKYPEIPAERSDDLHNLELADEADLVLFMAGNQFMVMQELIAAFQQGSPEVKNIYYETLPPGLELKQILAGGALFRDEPITVQADVYSSVNRAAMATLEQNLLIDKEGSFPYLRNRLVLMVPADNPARIKSVLDLGREEVRISQPDPRNEDIALHIIDMYRQAGGEELVRCIMEEKQAKGATLLTTVHHRETPVRIREKTVDVGPVWATEAVYARAQGLACEAVEPGIELDQRDRVKYYICRLKNGSNPVNAEKFLHFIKTPTAQRIYEAAGFIPGFQ